MNRNSVSVKVGGEEWSNSYAKQFHAGVIVADSDGKTLMVTDAGRYLDLSSGTLHLEGSYLHVRHLPKGSAVTLTVE